MHGTATRWTCKGGGRGRAKAPGGGEAPRPHTHRRPVDRRGLRLLLDGGRADGDDCGVRAAALVVAKVRVPPPSGRVGGLVDRGQPARDGARSRRRSNADGERERAGQRHHERRRVHDSGGADHERALDEPAARGDEDRVDASGCLRHHPRALGGSDGCERLRGRAEEDTGDAAEEAAAAAVARAPKDVGRSDPRRRERLHVSAPRKRWPPWTATHNDDRLTCPFMSSAA